MALTAIRYGISPAKGDSRYKKAPVSRGFSVFLGLSLMDEAIASSQIEGAATTRKKAKEMLRENRPPKNRSEKMIANNYITIKRIRSSTRWFVRFFSTSGWPMTTL
jgi:hypothetical protein